MRPSAKRRDARRQNKRKKVALYNKGILDIHRDNSLVICDWDDTLFPTSWIHHVDIDLTDIRTRYKYTRYFDKLDKHLARTIASILEHADLIIITNATMSWIYVTLTVLPATAKVLNNIPIVSARESFQNKCSMEDWKKYTFRQELKKRPHYRNITSIGDANYEHKALVALYHWNHIPHKYLKSIKFEKSTDCFDLIDQIRVIQTQIENIANAQRHLDLTLDIVDRY